MPDGRLMCGTMFPPRRFQPPLGPPPLSARERVLAQWRGTDLTALERAKAPGGRSAEQLVGQVLKELKLDRRKQEAEIARVWNQLLDPTVTAHAQPTGVVRGTLFVSVDSPVWLSEIVRYRRREILDRLRHSFGPDFIRKIAFRVG